MESRYFDVSSPSKKFSKLGLASLAVLCILGVVATIRLSSINSSTTSLDLNLESQDFNEFILKYSRYYTSHEEFQLRYSIFQNNLQKIKSHNSLDLPWKLAVNQYADLTWNEFAELKNIRHIERKQPKNVVRLENDTVPDAIDWVAKGVVTDVKNQGECGSCWAFSATGAIESAWAIKSGNLVSLSEQQLLDCSSGLGNDGCVGGDTDVAFEYVLDFDGILSEDDYPYTGEEARCKIQAKPAVKITEYVYVEQNNELELLKAVAQQPVSVAVESDEAVWQFYSSGVVTEGCNDNLDHAVLVVGYGTDKDIKFWRLKNSFGPGWGEEGYIRVLRTDSTTSSGMCGVAATAVYPRV